LSKHGPDALESRIHGPYVVCDLAAFEGIVLQPLSDGFRVPAKIVIGLAKASARLPWMSLAAKKAAQPE
jgi:hypothetical protein